MAGKLLIQGCLGCRLVRSVSQYFPCDQPKLASYILLKAMQLPLRWVRSEILRLSVSKGSHVNAGADFLWAPSSAAPLSGSIIQMSVRQAEAQIDVRH